jgi:alpha-tubulin suppressor-like RCC1 family protein
VNNIGWTLNPLLATGLLAVLACRQDAESPVAPQSVPALASMATALSFDQVAAGGVHTCGVASDARGYCWGGNNSGAIGDGTTTQRMRPVLIEGGLQFRQISAGSGNGGTTCGVAMDFKAYCWGANNKGQIGDGTTATRLKPVAVAGGHLFRRVDSEFFHTCGVSYPDNRGYCWGYNFYGQLGDGTTTDRLMPAAIAGTLRFRQVTTGGVHTCGVTTDDRAFCWGSNQYGQIGDNSTVAKRLRPALVVGGHPFMQVDAGNYHTCAVTTGNVAFCWGNGRNGEVGNGKTYLSFSPKRVAGGLSFDRVTAGLSHSCGETTLNRAYCWGSNTFGQLGDGTNSQRLTPVPVAGGHAFGQLSAGYVHTCGRTPAGVAYCWGENFNGELGDGTTDDSSTPVAVAEPAL